MNTQLAGKTLLLLDGNAIVHRAYHALPPLTTKSGEVVNAVYGFTATLLSVLEKFKPDYVAGSFDLPKPTFRHKAYAEYKATRVKAPDELYAQIPMVKGVVSAFGIPIYEMEGFEADDVVGTLARRAEAEGLKVIIVTGDMDTLQLVTDKISVFTMRKGINDTVVYDVPGVIGKYGFAPEQLPDYKGLRGDASDNIPGVKGIGDKTATQLLKEFMTLEGVYEHLDEIKSAVREKLERDKMMAIESKMLGTIRTDVPIDINFEKCFFDTNSPKKQEDMRSAISRFEFFSLLNRLPGVKGEPKQSAGKKQTIKRRYERVPSDRIESVLAEVRKRGEFSFALDWEGNAPYRGVLRGVAVSTKAGHARYIVIRKNPSVPQTGHLPLAGKENAEAMKKIFSDSLIKKIGYNVKEAMQVLEQCHCEHAKQSRMTKDSGIASSRAPRNDGGDWIDILLQAYLLQESSDLSLERLVLVGLGEEVSFAGAQETLFGVSDAGGMTPREEMLCEKADSIGKLYKIFEEKMAQVSASQKEGKTLREVFEKIEMPVVPVLAKMEAYGVQFDSVVFEGIAETINAKIKRLEQKIHELAGVEFNVNSTKQLRDILFNRLQIDTKDIKKTKTGYSTASSELQKIKGKYQIAEKIETYRELFKLKTTYVDVIPKLVDEGGRLHTTFNQAVAATGRLSSSDPNLQNIPTRTPIGRLLRNAFVSAPGYRLLSADYSQIDLRCAAHLSGDKKMIEAFYRGEDIHTTTASEVFGVSAGEVTKAQRRQAKVLNFGVLYGMGTFGFANAAGVDRKEAQAFISAYMEKFSGLAQYLKETKESAKEKGYVETEFGRRRYVPEINSANFQVASAGERIAINLPIQGLTADIMKLAMISAEQLAEEYGDRVRMLLQIHDELIFEVEESLEKEFGEKIKAVMEGVCKLRVPLVADTAVGNSWGEL